MDYKKIFIIIALLTVSGFLFNASEAKAITAAEIQAQIQALLNQIAQLQQQLAEVQGEETVWCHDFNINLGYGNTGSEVKALQTALEKEGFYKREFTGYFDEYTASAVVGFQGKYAADILSPWGLIYGTGYVGRTTRAKLNEIYGCKEKCKTNQDCLAKEFCEFPVGTCKGPGECIEKPKICPTLYDPVCGCDDKTYANDCSRKMAGVSKKYDGKCKAETCHTVPLWSWDYCSPDCKCNAGQGDCDTDADCNTGYCAHNVGAKYGQVSTMDVCEEKVEKSITVLSPNGGEEFQQGTNLTITWDFKGIDYVNIDLLDWGRQQEDGTVPFVLDLANNYSALKRTYTWKIPLDWPTGNLYKIRIEHAGKEPISDTSDNYFSIISPEKSITVLSPNGGEKWVVGKTYGIRWNSVGVDKINIELENWKGMPAGGPFTILLAQNITANLGRWDWTVGTEQKGGPELGDYYKIRVVDASNTSPYAQQIADSSDNYFSIVEAVCTDSDGIDYYIKGTCLSAGATTGIEDSCKDSNTLWEWHCGTAEVNKNVCVYTEYKCPYGCKDGACVVPKPKLIYPSHNSIVSSLTLPLRWESSPVAEVRYYQWGIWEGTTVWPGTGWVAHGVEYKKNEITIPAGKLDWNKTYIWIVRACTGYLKGCSEWSDGWVFTTKPEVQPSITVLSPNGGEKWEMGKSYDITWEYTNVQPEDKVNILLLPGGATLGSLVNASLGKFTWPYIGTALGIEPGSNYKIKVVDASDSSIFDQSDDYFSIVEAVCTDSDNWDYYKKGTCWSAGATTGIEDSCKDSNTLWEWHCGTAEVNKNVCVYTEYKCPYGCKDGACQPEGGSMVDSCNDLSVVNKGKAGVNDGEAVTYKYCYQNGVWCCKVSNGFNSAWEIYDFGKVTANQIIIDLKTANSYNYGVQIQYSLDKSSWHKFPVASVINGTAVDSCTDSCNFVRPFNYGSWQEVKLNLSSLISFRYIRIGRGGGGSFRGNPSVDYLGFSSEEGLGLKYIENQLASIANAISQMVERIRELFRR